MKFLTAAVIASAIVTAAASSTKVCMTGSGAHSVKKVPTKTFTSKTKKTITITKTTNVSTTVTASASTTTVTDTTTSDTTTTLSTSTDVVSTTVFTTTTTTVEANPVTETDTSTTETTTTTTVGPFFTPVQDSLPGVEAYQPVQANKRDLTDSLKMNSPRRNMLEARRATTQYPTAVTCSVLITKTTKKTTTVAGTTSTSTVTPAPVTSTETDTITVTDTVVPSDVTSTDTISSTITNTETDTSTSTTTTTTTVTDTATVQASPTVVCDSTNYAEAVGAYNIINATPETNSEDFMGTSDNSLGECCLSCQALPNCGAFSFLTSTNACQVATTSGTCNLNGDSFQVLLGDQSRTTPLIVGNGLCGEYNESLDQ